MERGPAQLMYEQVMQVVEFVDLMWKLDVTCNAIDFLSDIAFD